MLDVSTLNEAQREAVTAGEGPLLVIAGAGSGKTRTIVYRLAWLVEQGCDASSMLLLTFTRKAAQEMLDRASILLEQQLMGVQGGTFHAFAFSVLRRWQPEWLLERGAGLSVMDSADSASAIQHCKAALNIGKGDRSFPRTQTVISLLSKARNKEMELEDVLRREAQHLLPHASDIIRLGEAYAAYRREHALLDYDDLLFELEAMLKERPDVLDAQRRRFRHVLVDEYQDTNRVQARLVRLLAGEGEKAGVMAVGDDAQSIYAFRGATVHNILDFPKLFPGTRIVRLEENYRSVQPVLDVANALLENAPEGYRKRLFSRRECADEPAVRLYRPLSDLTQGRIAARRIAELLDSVRPEEIAVLFRAGYQSYHLEVELNKLGIPFRKYGGLRYAEASHVKDVLAFARLVLNPLDLPSFERIAALSKGIGPRTSRKLYDAAAAGDAAVLRKAGARYPDFLADLELVASLRPFAGRPVKIIADILEHYRPRLEIVYPDDWPRRQQGLEELSTIAAGYDDLGTFIGDLALESPEDDEADADLRRRVVLSTVHSAKGLEWAAVLILDLVEDRFPSRHALARADDYEEERRLMYVACTRARDSLDLFVPMSLYSRSAGGQEPAVPSPFVRELPLDGMDEYYETYGGVMALRRAEGRESGPACSAHASPRDSAVLPGSMFSPSSRFLPPVRRTEPDDIWDEGADDLFDEDGNPLPRAPRFSARPFSGERGAARREARIARAAARASRDPDDEYLADITAHPDREETVSRPASGGQSAGGRDAAPAEKLGFCRHRVFGRGKIVEALPPDRYRVNFPGFGLKVILAAYLSMEE